MTYVPSYDYIFINHECQVLGRHSERVYIDDFSGLHLGLGNSITAATKIAEFYKDRIKYGIKYSEKVELIPEVQQILCLPMAPIN